MKRKWGLAVVLALVCVMLLGIGVAADTVAEGTCGDDLTWVLDDAGVLTISGEGEMEDYGDGSNDLPPWDSYYKKIKSIVIKEGVTSIGNHTFSRSYNSGFNYITGYYEEVDSIYLPDSLVSIGNYAFFGCFVLEEIAFGKNLASIGNAAFGKCTNLSVITIKSDFTCQWTSFKETNIDVVKITDTVSSINTSILKLTTISKFEVDQNNQYGLISIDDVLYQYDDYLESYTLLRHPAAKTETTYTINEKTEKIGAYAFANCTIDNLIWNSFISSIDYDWCNDSSILKITLPEDAYIIPEPPTLTYYEVVSTNNIGYRDINGVLFYYDIDTKQLTLIKYPDGRTDAEYIIPAETNVIGSSAFYYNKYPYENTYLTNVVFPNSVKTISDKAFSNCTCLTKLIFNDGLTSIGDYAFADCTGLKEIKFPDTIVSIGLRAFYDCTYIKEISFSESLQSLGWNAFSNCTALRRAYFYGNTPTYCSSDAFSNTHSTFTIYYISGKSGWTSPTWNGYNTATFVPEGYSLTPKSTSTYTFTDATITNVPAGTTVSTFTEQFDNTDISLTTATGTSLSDTAMVGTGCVVCLTVDGTVVDSRTIVVTGDMDGDGLTSATDLTLLQQYYRGYAVTIAYPAAADLNGDGKMTRADAMVLARQLAGWTDALTPPSDVIVIG